MVDAAGIDAAGYVDMQLTVYLPAVQEFGKSVHSLLGQWEWKRALASEQ